MAGCVRVDVNEFETSESFPHCDATRVILVITRPQDGTTVKYWTSIGTDEIPDQIIYVPTSELPPGICDVDTDDNDVNAESKNETEHWLPVKLILELAHDANPDDVEKMLAPHLR